MVSDQIISTVKLIAVQSSSTVDVDSDADGIRAPELASPSPKNSGGSAVIKSVKADLPLSAIEKVCEQVTALLYPINASIFLVIFRKCHTMHALRSLITTAARQVCGRWQATHCNGNTSTYRLATRIFSRQYLRWRYLLSKMGES